jgi:cytochrome o ubiquinol oxidase subunit 1
VIGFYLAFMPSYLLGLMGVTRRMSHFSDPSLQIWFQISALGAIVIAFGIFFLLVQLYVSFRRRHALRDVTGDPWNGRTLEWSTSSPPPEYNFAFTPRVHDNDTWADMKREGYQRPRKGFTAIHMPKNTGAGFIIALLSSVVAFGIIWHMWVLVVLGFLATLAAIIIHTFNYDREYYIPADQVIRTENARTAMLEQHV